MNKTKTLGVFFILMALVSINLVLGFGVAGEYHNARPLKMLPGTTEVIEFQMQNTAPTAEDTTVEVAIADYAAYEFASMDEKYSTVSIEKGKTKTIELTITIPETAELGEEYSVSVNFLNQPPEAGGTIALSSVLTKRIPIVIADPYAKDVPGDVPPAPELSKWAKERQEVQGLSTFSWIVIILVLALLVVMFVISIRKKKK